MAVSASPDIEIKARITEIRDNSFELYYEALNRGPSTVYLFNRLYRQYTEEGIFELDPDLVYISAAGDTVRLFKGVPDIPEGVLPEIPIVPCASRLESGRKLEETIRIARPLRVFNPYLPEREETLPPPRQIVFALGYFPEERMGRRRANRVRTNQGLAEYAEVAPWDQLISDTTPMKLQPGASFNMEDVICPGCGRPVSARNRFCNHCGKKLE